MDLVVVFIFIFVFLVSLLVIKKPKNLPPGYFGIPYIGSLSLMRKLRGKRPHLVFFEEYKRIGNVFRWYLGNQLIVVLSGYDTIHEALVKKAEVFSDRPEFSRNPIDTDSKGENGIVFGKYGHCWRELRRFTLQALRDFGVGKASIEEKIQVEIEAASTCLQETNGKPTSVDNLMQKVVANVIFGIVFGQRYEYNDPDFDKTRAMTSLVLSGAGPISTSFFLPKFLVRIIDKKDAENNDVRRLAFTDLRNYVYKQIDEHGSTFDRDNIRDFIDMYIQIEKEGDESLRKFITRGNFFRAITDLFLAGSETTSTTLDWAFLFITEFPEVQKKCQEEIGMVLGNKLIENSDRKKLTYVNAVIMEIQRCAHLVPLNVVHFTSENTTLGGFTIPAGTWVLPTLYTVDMDPKYFPNPEKFDPDRFIDEKGNLVKNEALIPFSTGPRTCLGEPLARMELFLVFANLLQRFNFARENPNKPHTFECKQGQVVNAPVPYRLRATKRQ